MLAERIGRDLVSNAHVLSPNGIYEREAWTPTELRCIAHADGAPV